ncbi:YafY family transcriptional regulator [Algoriphagus aestuarii]|nr:YafY family transcriptional regulator [Algoriphagus aestuarii]
MNRIDRLTGILTHLQSKRTIKAVELADRFGVSLRTIYRDVRALEETGVPIIGEAGQGYSLVDGYRLPPVMFSKKEALAFIVAEKLVEKQMDEESITYFKEALIKIKAILRSDEKDMIGRMDDSILVLESHSISPQKKQSKNFQKVLDAISERKILNTVYSTFEPRTTTHRTLEPVGTYHSYSQWYMIAYCHLRKDYRTFRIDRFEDIQLSEETYVRSKHPKMQRFLDKLCEEQKLYQIVVRVQERGLKYLQNMKYNLGYVSEKTVGQETEMVFMNSSLEWFLRSTINMTDMLRILEPEELKSKLEDLLADIKVMQYS